MLRAHSRTETSGRLPALSGCAERKWIWPRATAPVAVPRAGSPAHPAASSSQLSGTLKANQSKQSRTERLHVPQGSVSQSARTIGVGKTHLSDLHGSFLREK